MGRFYTTVEQSKKLQELGLNPGTADMFYCHEYNPIDHKLSYDNEPTIPSEELTKDVHDTPCWSLDALFKLMPRIKATAPVIVRCLTENKFFCHYHGIGSYKEVNTTESYEDPIDAAFEMVVWLIEHEFIKVKKD